MFDHWIVPEAKCIIFLQTFFVEIANSAQETQLLDLANCTTG